MTSPGFLLGHMQCHRWGQRDSSPLRAGVRGCLGSCVRQSCPACTCVASWGCGAQNPSCSPHGALGAAAPPALSVLALKEPLWESDSFSPSGRGGLASGREGLAFLMSAQRDQIEEEENMTWKWGSTNYELAAGSCWRGKDAVSLPSQILAWRLPGCMDLRPGMAPPPSPTQW